MTQVRGRFDRFSDKVNDVWSSASWWLVCLAGVVAWLVVGAVGRLWTNATWHLILNSPTTALTFLGVFLGLNGTLRFENAVNARFERLFEHLGIEDPVNDEGQKS